MFTRQFRPLSRGLWKYAKRPSQPPAANAYRLLNTVPTCPSPTCDCAKTPAMPEGLPIDTTSPLNGVMASYAEQLLICTGKDDWPSRIEEENSGDNLAADLKELLGRGGLYSDVSFCCGAPVIRHI